MLSLSTDKVDLICYDFDGVMTDNTIFVLQDGTEAVRVNRSDGLAVAAFRRLGIPQVILSTEENPVVSARARKLNIPVLQGLSDKRHALENYAAERRLSLARTIYVGNDINDLEAMKCVGFPIAPADAAVEIRALAVHVTHARGGAGVVRELLDLFNRQP